MAKQPKITHSKPRRATFFLAEMGDKIQIVTIALAAEFKDFFDVVYGTTLGMVLAKVPAI